MVSETSFQPSQRRHTRDSGGSASLWQKGITGVLLLLLVVVLARLGLVILSPDAAVEPVAAGPDRASRDRVVDLASLQSRQLFGTRSINSESGAPVLATTGDLPAVDETRLNLRLDGVVVGKPATAGFAMIAVSGRSGTFRIGDRLPVGSRVVLNNIYPDRVILENDGRMETLWLYDETTGNRPAAKPTSRATDLAQVLSGSYDPMALVNEYREKFAGQSRAADFLTLSEIVKISPEYANTQLLGYRLSPGEHLKEFVRLGLKTNDIVTQVNGIELTNIANLPNLFDVMSTARQVTLTLVREGRPMDLTLSLDELPRVD